MPQPQGPWSVSPWITSTFSGSMPSRSAAICAKLVSSPWPCGEVPVNTVADPDGCTRTMADSQNAAWRPTP